jgi:hypothetical protein
LSLIEKPLFLQDEGALVVPPAFAGDYRPHWAITAATVLLTMLLHPCEESLSFFELPVWMTGLAFDPAQIIQFHARMSRE